MDKAYNKKEAWTVVLFGIIIFGIIEMVFIRVVFPSYYTNFLLLIPVYFLILGVGVLLILSRMRRKRLHPGRAVARLMLFNVSQMIVSFLLLVGYYYFFDVREHTVLFTFSVFYIFFMGIKMFILYNIDHQRNIDIKKNKHAGDNK
ncbi:MAG: hypothetical protein LBC19_16660 [Tannerella sp.]|jgi:uncharacterized membrane protein YhaH (DUF805 family)|nr:hypothetical protein [Tannerella sp.]